MSEFKYFEDFNRKVQCMFFDIEHQKIEIQEVYIIKIKIEKFGKLETNDQKHLRKKYHPFKFQDDNKIIKLYSSASFHYVIDNCLNQNNVKCNEMKIESTLFDNKISFPILFSKFTSVLSEYENNGWYRKFNKECSIIIIAKINKGINEFNKRIPKIFRLHEDYDLNSLNTKNMSMKKNNAIVEEFKKLKLAFDPSLETTLLNIIKFIFDKYSVKNKISLISLFKLTANDGRKLAWEKDMLYKKEDLKLDENQFEMYIIYKITSYYFGSSGDSIEKVNYAYLKELTLPLGFSDQNLYYLVIPITKNKGNVQFRYAMVLMENQPFETYILDNINGLLSEYYSCYLEEQKSKLLFELQRALFDRNIYSNENAKKRLIKKTEESFHVIVQITNAYSATFRLFNPVTRNLEKIVNVANKEGKAYQKEDEHKYINVDKNKYNSLNCRTFWLQEGEKCALYISNITRPKKRKDNEKNFSTLHSRVQTLSELCVPFYYQGVIIGVMNFESPIFYAFDDECEQIEHQGGVQYYNAENKDEYIKLHKSSFIYTIKSTLQHFYCLTEERNDIKFLSRLIEMENSLHELKNQLGAKSINLNTSKELLKKLLQSGTTLSVFDDKMIPIKEKLLGIQLDLINKYNELLGDFSPFLKDDFVNTKRLRTYLPITFENNKSVYPQTANSIEVIYKYLLKNYLIHGDVNNDILSIKYIKSKKLLIISQVFNIPLERKDEMFLSPYMNRGRKSSGLFIVGTHVRQLGGYIFTNFNEHNKLKNVDIHIHI